MPRPADLLTPWVRSRGLVLLPLTLFALGAEPCTPCTDNDGDEFCDDVDCDDSNAAINPTAPELCDGLDNNCNGLVDDGILIDWWVDADLDGYGDGSVPPEVGCTPVLGWAYRAGDCDDALAPVNPDALESANGIDDDCDGEIDEGSADADADGYSVASGDCNDQDPTRYPRAEELCDNVDNNCNGVVDEGLDRYYFPDLDGDGFGVLDKGVCASVTGYVTSLGDCNESDASIHPGAPDVDLDGVDSDCGGTDAPEPHVGFPGSSYTTVQSAIDAASAGATVFVAPGLYLETGLRFGGKAITVSGTGWPEVTTLDAQGLGRVFTFDAAETASSILRRFTLTKGRADLGGGVYTYKSSPTLENLIISANVATTSGGGVYFDGGAPVLISSRVTGNRAENVYGGGGSISASSTATLTNVIFQQNESKLEGGGLAVSSAKATITDSRFVGNKSVTSRGGGVHMRNAQGSFLRTQFQTNVSIGASGTSSYGGGLYLDSSPISVKDSSFVNNTATYGAAVYLVSSNADFTNTVIENNAGPGRGAAMYLYQSNPNLTNCILRNNRADNGGALYLFESGPTLLNVQATGNVAAYAGGAMYLFESAPRIFSLVATRNSATAGGGLYLYGNNTTPHVENSIIAYNTVDNVLLSGTGADDWPAPEMIYNDLYNPSGVTNHNMTALDSTNSLEEPQFLSYGADGLPSSLHLSLLSPLVDAGLNYEDADGSPVDLGLYGGVYGDTWDIDLDGHPDWYWAGSYSNVPWGVEASAFDRDDSNVAVF